MSELDKTPRGQRKLQYAGKRFQVPKVSPSPSEGMAVDDLEGITIRGLDWLGRMKTIHVFNGYEFNSVPMAIAYGKEFLGRLGGRAVTEDVRSMISREAYHNFRNARGKVVNWDGLLTDVPISDDDSDEMSAGQEDDVEVERGWRWFNSIRRVLFGGEE